MPVTFAARRTPHGHACGEVASALQKSIRRGDERDALYWASELELAGFGNYVWKRLRIISSEDVGIGDPMVCVQVRALYDNWVDQQKADRGTNKVTSRLFLTHAIVVLARARKSRLLDHATMVTYFGKRPKLEIPDYALDKHTAAGKRKGRGWAHFFDEASLLKNKAELKDTYEREARAMPRHDKENPWEREGRT